MTVRLKAAAALAAIVLAFHAGCGGGSSVTFAAETDDPYYREGQRLVRQGRDAEALSAFLKVIEKRGEQASAESHLEAGLICLNHIKDPIEAIHHFRKYLELQPNAKQAPGVRGLIDTAKREFARTLPAHPLESQAIGVDPTELTKLQRENEDLRAEITNQKTAATTQFLRSSRTTIEPSEPSASPPSSGGVPLITPAPMQTRATRLEPTITAAPPSSAQLFAPPGSQTKGTRPGAPAAAGSHKHTVAAGDTLYNVAKKYGVKMEDIVAANHDVLPSVTSPLRRGAELKIP